MTQSARQTKQVDYEKSWLLEKEMNEKMSKLVESSETLIQKLKKDLSAEKQEKEIYKYQYNELKKQVHLLTFEKKKLQSKIQGLKENDSADTVTLESKSDKKKDKEILQLTNHCEALKHFSHSNLSLKDKTIENLKSRIDDNLKKTRKMSGELKEKDAEIQKLKESEGFYIRRMKAMKRDLEDIRKKDSGLKDSDDHPMEVECVEDSQSVKHFEKVNGRQGVKDSEGVAKEHSNVVTEYQSIDVERINGTHAVDVDSVLEIASLKSEVDLLRQAYDNITKEKDQEIAQLQGQYEMSSNTCIRLNEILIHVQSTGQIPNWYRF
ncbi:hypothetical protein GCK72_022792 [Caenorhabditis remanei]|uniref:Uncharacterized protein n=1 Tax=Caenorhabditis remanei TaxID=31234 RepID=A0A6A5FV45_CAERE|nr:hypothetical protein GCK72_022792 [Caenorhabditis remanei]KAF1746339.1 hypothetical protein GCK72_022792 [Caenorhabditis remanei]